MKTLIVCEKCGLMNHAGKGCPKRKKVSGKKPKRAVLSIDCETNKNGVVLFLASGEERNVSYVYKAEGLGLKTILDWIIDTCAGKLCFGFYFDYDVNQIIGMLPPIHQGQLAACGKVNWRGYRIRHTPGKRLMVGNDQKLVTIWDCASWAQCAFIRVCDDWRLGTPEERALVRRMKEKRGDFDDAGEAELVEYTTLECVLLSEWVRRLLQLHIDCGISLRAYSGPGSTASAMVHKAGWKPPPVPPRVQEIAEMAFFGGRTEISCIGPVNGPVYGYDINSAYPSAIAALPEILGAVWKRTKKYKPGMWGFYRVRWNQPKSDCWGMFPMRGAMLESGKRSVSLLYPITGEGWFHSFEVIAALELAPDCIEVVDGWVIDPVGEPFAWVREGVKLRMEYKAAKDERQFPLKVGFNSIYGKFAQHSGTHPLQCMVYAAAITSATRALLLRAAYHRQHEVILLATDGILSTTPLDELTVGPGLGEWETETYDSAWMLQAGVYWCGQKKRTRGIDARTLELSEVEQKWETSGTSATLTLPSRRVLSYRLCAAQGKLHLTGSWCNSVRSVKFSASPRRRSLRMRGGRMLTLPASVSAYLQQVEIDRIAIQLGGLNDFEDEALPDWALPE